MQLAAVTEQVATQLSAAAALGDERTREIAAALAAAAAPAVRLAVLEATSQMADEVTAALLDVPGGPVVSVRLDSTHGDGDEVLVDVRLAETAPAAASAPPRDDGDPSARISLRLSEALKAEVEGAAARDGLSVNTWLVRAAGAALDPGPFAGFGRPFGGAVPAHADHPRHPRANNQHVTGWVNG